MRVLCYLVGIFVSLRALALISGCDYRRIRCSDRNLHILRCERCRRWDVAWRTVDPR